MKENGDEMAPKKIWILVANGHSGKTYESAKRNEGLREALPYELHMPNPPSGKKGNDDRPGRVHESADVSRHAMEPHSDPEKLAKESFARHVATLLGEEAQKGKFDELVVVASPEFLGDLRDELHGEIRKKIVGEVDKDLTHMKPKELRERVSAELDLLL
ncbi:MAG: Host attachment protein [Parvibaculum sp.]|nr:Host attachment protein [Parvibaculum sp.]